MEKRPHENNIDRPSCDPWITFLVIICIISIAILVKLISSMIWLPRQPQIRLKITTDALVSRLKHLQTIKDSLKKLTVKFFHTMTNEEKQSVLNSSFTGKKQVVVVEPGAAKNGISKPIPRVIIFPEQNRSNIVLKNDPSTSKPKKKLKFPNFKSKRKNETKGVWKNKLNVSEYKKKLKKPFTMPTKKDFPNFKNAPNKNKIMGTRKSKASNGENKVVSELFNYPSKNYSPNSQKASLKNENKNKTETENNLDDIRLLADSFRKMLSIFTEKEDEKQTSSTSKPRWLGIEFNVLQKWIDRCLKNSVTASIEEEENIEPEMYIPYNKKEFNKTFFSHPSLFPFAAVARIFKVILQTTLIIGIIILALIMIAFAKVKETHNYSYIRDKIAKTNTFQNLKQAFGAGQKSSIPKAVLNLKPPASICSTQISLLTILEDTATSDQSQSLYDWEWIEKVYLTKEGSSKFPDNYSLMYK